MGIPDAIEATILILLCYPFIWLTTFDPNLRIRVHLSLPSGEEADQATFTVPPRFLSAQACVWTIALAFAVFAAILTASKSITGFYSSIATAGGAVVVGKLVVAPWTSSMKSLRVDRLGARRTIRLIVHDYLANWLLSLINKLGLLGIVSGAIWAVTEMLGLTISSSSFPLPILITWVLYFLGRASIYYRAVQRLQAEYVVFQRVEVYASQARLFTDVDRLLQSRIVDPPLSIGVQYAILILSMFPVTVAIELILRDFGWSADNLPSIIHLALGLGGPLLIDLPLTIFGARARRNS